MSLKSKPLDQVRSLPAVAVLAQEEVVRINLNVPKSVRNQWKAAALQRGDADRLIMNAMSQYSNSK